MFLHFYFCNDKQICVEQTKPAKGNERTMENAKQANLKDLLDMMRARGIPVAIAAWTMELDEYELIEKMAEQPYTAEFEYKVLDAIQKADNARHEYRYSHYDEYLENRKAWDAIMGREEPQDDEA